MDNPTGNQDWQPPLEPMPRVGTTQRTVLHILYLLLSFPMVVFYFVFLVTGITVGITTLIIWIGVPILMLTMVAWWYLAAFERVLAIRWLHVDIRPMSLPSKTARPWLRRFRENLSNAMTWKSLTYLLVKFPLGILSLIVSICILTLTFGISLVLFTLALIIAPFFYLGLLLTRSPNALAGLWEVFPIGFQGVGVFLILPHVLHELGYVPGAIARLMLLVMHLGIQLLQT